MLKQADALKVCPIPDACLLVMAQRPARLHGSPETRSLIFLIKNSPDQVEGYPDYLQPLVLQVQVSSQSLEYLPHTQVNARTHTQPGIRGARRMAPLVTPHTICMETHRSLRDYAFNDPRASRVRVPHAPAV
jgi:hypothetical protein